MIEMFIRFRCRHILLGILGVFLIVASAYSQTSAEFEGMARRASEHSVEIHHLDWDEIEPYVVRYAWIADSGHLFACSRNNGIFQLEGRDPLLEAAAFLGSFHSEFPELAQKIYQSIVNDDDYTKLEGLERVQYARKQMLVQLETDPSLPGIVKESLLKSQQVIELLDNEEFFQHEATDPADFFRQFQEASLMFHPSIVAEIFESDDYDALENNEERRQFFIKEAAAKLRKFWEPKNEWTAKNPQQYEVGKRGDLSKLFRMTPTAVLIMVK